MKGATILDLKPYPEYQYSGVKGLGRVPAHWEVGRLARFGRLFKGKGGSKRDSVDDGVPCVRYGDLYTTHDSFIRNSRSLISTAAACKYTPIEFGDILFAASGETVEEIGASAVNLMESEAYCGGDVIVFRPECTIDAKYAGYVAGCRPMAAQKASMGRGFTVIHIYGRQLKHLVIPLPPLDEQTAIAHFLDVVDEQVSRLVEAEEKLVGLLEELRASLISEAVTGQIDVRTRRPYPAYKTSGIEWLGLVPKHWEMRPLKWVSHRRVTGVTPPTSESIYYRDGTIPWYGPSSCDSPEEVGIPVRHLTDSAIVERKGRLVVGPALLVVVIGASLGRMALLMREGSTNQQITAFELSSALCHPRFILHQLRGAQSWLRSVASSATIPILDIGLVARLQCALPPLEEQAAIVEYLEGTLYETDTAISNTRREIELLEEFRTRIISDVVTGKVDVREAVGRLGETAT